MPLGKKSELKATRVKLCTQKKKKKRCIKLRLFWKTSADHRKYMHRVPSKKHEDNFLTGWVPHKYHTSSSGDQMPKKKAGKSKTVTTWFC